MLDNQKVKFLSFFNSYIEAIIDKKKSKVEVEIDY